MVCKLALSKWLTHRYSICICGGWYGLWSRRSDRKQERYKHGACAALMAAFAIAIALIVNQPWAIIVGFILLAIGVFSAINIFWTIPGKL